MDNISSWWKFTGISAIKGGPGRMAKVGGIALLIGMFGGAIIRSFINSPIINVLFMAATLYGLLLLVAAPIVWGWHKWIKK